MADWRPLSRRGTDPSPEEDALYEGVPPHLVQPLLHWIDSLFEHTSWRDEFPASERRAGRIAARVRLDLRAAPLGDAHAQNDTDVWCASRALVHLAGASGDTVLLDVVDAALAEGTRKGAARDLEQLLTGGGSAPARSTGSAGHDSEPALGPDELAGTPGRARTRGLRAGGSSGETSRAGAPRPSGTRPSMSACLPG